MLFDIKVTGYQDRKWKTIAVYIPLSLFVELKCSYIYNFKLIVNSNILTQYKLLLRTGNTWSFVLLIYLGVFVSFSFNTIKQIALLASISNQRDCAPIPNNSCYFQDTNARKHFKTAQHSHKAFITTLVGLLFNEIPVRVEGNYKQ